ncbi:uncharacterized protein LOC119613389 [Lucilia sericata]|uniref:uncharacterized protein LOC119613389 n=1 Tax=Lucilia sericata TaxID=13632 RepID=UPI0018A84932|nr:uncharacterized protein LOC119613389 [Lucilia sericata]XP_037825350.1 uncharacterized protein LOC119613389 [Lucilia sericata]
MGRRKDKPRLIPEQDKRICRAICLCQLTMVLSCVSIVYLSVAIYAPSFKAFKSGFELDPVMCQTIQSDMPDSHCSWASCGEWCLTRTSGFCPQIYSIVRRNGTDIQLNNCTRITNTSCAMIDMSRLNKFNCNNGTACNNIHGVFNCSNGHCKNMSEFFLCHHKADGPTINSAKDNTKLNGFFECHGVHCTKIKKPFSCDRYCSKITTSHINVLLMHEDNVIAADCENAVAFNEARGNELGVRISPTEFWKEDDGNLLTNCATVTREGDKIMATDCLNGTLLPHNILPEPFMNFTQFWKIYEESKIEVDPEQKFLPNQHNLTIYKNKKLFINLEGCVNTLRGECKDFHARHGSDGDNNTAQSRYQCYYNKDPSVEFVTSRYDLKKVYNELLFSLIVPIVLFVISSISLIIITTYVKVGDDAKMRCICGGEESDADEIYSSRKSKRNRQAQNLETMDNLNQMTDLAEHDVSPADANAMIGSTKSLLPLSPTNESGTTDNTFDDEKASKCDMPEKPLVVI